jgi:hypothetical protein
MDMDRPDQEIPIPSLVTASTKVEYGHGQTGLGKSYSIVGYGINKSMSMDMDRPDRESPILPSVMASTKVQIWTWTDRIGKVLFRHWLRHQQRYGYGHGQTGL